MSSRTDLLCEIAELGEDLYLVRVIAPGSGLPADAQLLIGSPDEEPTRVPQLSGPRGRAAAFSVTFPALPIAPLALELTGAAPVVLPVPVMRRPGVPGEKAAPRPTTPSGAAEHDVSPGRAFPDDRWARIFVWSCLVLLSASTAYFVLRAGRNVPIQEDWHVIAAATGHQDGFWSWVWEPNNEHRVPIQKLIYVFLFRLWPDFRVGMVFNVALLSLLAAAFIVFLRHVRGRTRWTDAFFPVIFLHLGNWENFGWSWQLTFVFATVLACAVLFLLTWSREAWTVRRALLLAGCLVTIPFTGATALPFAAAVAVACLLESRGAQGRPRTILRFSGIITLVLSGLYFFHLPRSTWVPASPGIGTDLLTGAKFLALGLGPGAGVLWLGTVLAMVVALASAAALVWRGRRGRVGSWALLAFLAAGLALALESGKSRAGAVPFFGLPDRYALVATPLVCGVYLAWELYGGRRVRRLGPAVFCGLVLALLPVNIVYGNQWKNWYQQRVDTFAADVEAGVPVAELIRYRPLGWEPGEMWLGLQYMRLQKIGVFRDVRLVPPRVRAWQIDEFARGGAGWATIRGPGSRARLVHWGGQAQLRWNYDTTSKAAAVVGRAFARPADWRGAGAMAVTVGGQGSGKRIRIRVTMDGPRGDPLRFDTWFSDATATTRTVIMPWNGFGRVNARGEFIDVLKGAMPLTGIRSVSFIVSDPGPGHLTIKRVALTPGHPQLGWPLHPAVDRRSLPPWR